MSRRVVVGFSGGVTSAWCAGWVVPEALWKRAVVTK